MKQDTKQVKPRRAKRPQHAPASKSPRVAIVAANPAALFELACAVELFALPRPEFSNWYRTKVVTFAKEPVQATAGVGLQVTKVTNLDSFDMAIIPNWPSQPTPVSAALRNSLFKLRERGGRVLSFCSGSFLLAELGLLDNRSATTHWRYAEQFRQRFPQVHYVDDVLYIYDGAVGCSAGSAAGIDLGLAVIRADYGYKIANQVARRLVISAHRQGGQAQYVETPLLEKPNQFSRVLDWALKNLDKPIDIDSLASRAAMSRRTFDRKFRASLAMSPQVWLLAQRIERAKELLVESQHNIEKIAELTGFAQAVTFRHHFRKMLGVSPSEYRQKFCRSG